MNKPKVYIDGKEGTTGLQIYERLGNRDDIELLLIDEDKRKDTEERRKFLNAADLLGEGLNCCSKAALYVFITVAENLLYSGTCKRKTDNCNCRTNNYRRH